MTILLNFETPAPNKKDITLAIWRAAYRLVILRPVVRAYTPSFQARATMIAAGPLSLKCLSS